MSIDLFDLCICTCILYPTNQTTDDIEEVDLVISATRPVFPPRPHCVAASNGWIVAVIECSYPPNLINMIIQSSSSADKAAGNNNTHYANMTKQGLTTLIPPLRLVR